jgi:hypothetical protein
MREPVGPLSGARVNGAEFVQLALEPLPQRTFRPQLVQQHLGLCKTVRLDLLPSSKEQIDTTLNFGFGKQLFALASRCDGTSPRDTERARLQNLTAACRSPGAIDIQWEDIRLPLARDPLGDYFRVMGPLAPVLDSNGQLPSHKSQHRPTARKIFRRHDAPHIIHSLHSLRRGRDDVVSARATRTATAKRPRRNSATASSWR